MKAIKINGIEIYVEESDRYVQVNDISEHDLKTVWESINRQFPGYEFVFCFRNVAIPKDALAEIGAEVLEDCIYMQATKEGYIPAATAGVVPLEKADFPIFAQLHDKINPEVRQSRQIWDEWDRVWRIFVVKHDGAVTGYVMLNIAITGGDIGEIFAVVAENHAQRMALISAAVDYAFAARKATVVYMVERDIVCEYKAALELGFRDIGFYIGYVVRGS